jgi:hypothetical protein
MKIAMPGPNLCCKTKQNQGFIPHNTDMTLAFSNFVLKLKGRLSKILNWSGIGTQTNKLYNTDESTYSRSRSSA